MSEIKKVDISEKAGTKSPVLRVMANIISFVFHPLFMPVVLTFGLYKLAPASFAGFSPQNFNMAMVILAINTLLFPLLTVLLLKGLGFLQSFYMQDPKDRIIPLIAIMIFYFWAYLVFKNKIFNAMDTPFILRMMLLGNFWGVILLFLINIFFKVSMHTSATGGVLGVIIVLMMISPVNMLLPLLLAIIVCGLVGTARLLTGAHKPAQIWAGYVLGVVVQVAAYIYLK